MCKHTSKELKVKVLRKPPICVTVFGNLVILKIKTSGASNSREDTYYGFFTEPHYSSYVHLVISRGELSFTPDKHCRLLYGLKLPLLEMILQDLLHLFDQLV